MKTKVCSRCKAEKPMSEFSPRPERAGGLAVRPKCKLCNVLVTKEWRKKKKEFDPEGYKSMLKRHRLNCDPERVKETKDASYRRCFDREPWKFRAKSRAWWEKNKEKARKSVREWGKRNPLKRREACLRRKARMKGVPIEAVDREKVFRRDGGRCQMCKKEVDKTALRGWHLDHIVPLYFGGEHSMANVRVLCPTCNLSKGHRILPSGAPSEQLSFWG